MELGAGVPGHQSGYVSSRAYAASKSGFGAGSGVGVGAGAGVGVGAGAGGGGGYRASGFGPAPLQAPSLPFSALSGTSYPVTVGGGGGTQSQADGVVGSPSYFGPPSTPNGITATGGGAGG